MAFFILFYGRIRLFNAIVLLGYLFYSNSASDHKNANIGVAIGWSIVLIISPVIGFGFLRLVISKSVILNTTCYLNKELVSKVNVSLTEVISTTKQIIIYKM